MFIAADLGNAWIVWLTFPIAEVITGGIAAGLMLRVYRSKIKVITESREPGPNRLEF